MLAVGIGPIGPFEGIIILLVVVLIFGVGRLSDLGGAVGKSIREFRKAAREPDDDEQPRVSAAAAPPEKAQQAAGRFCSKCGAQLNGEEKFCAKCGAPTEATVS